ncbi:MULTISPECIES: acylneuraminate cytidylyltransferase family protein [Sporosarcina]|uniref:N-acylneuraminate cytidylyltransferase n=1 Tax=Sporosarcina newyorkensis TaxID=759851 RepID=A0A1T4Y2I8_9BACL|nr:MULTISPECIES: acylneuraminate cytidylyltransferase family protein [Sporosarcina]MBY0223487.1 acylneuraminate cytidylyltransferase family protein [Sporosarcina aquimarina]SKA95698.1 N-acylneuraminate cytidylyltransferase [Sporosarcina newyorkensis]
MINDKKVLAVITARGGSKGVPGKNIKNLAEKPLIAWTIEEAQRSQYIDRLILSSEDREIIETAKKYGCDVPFVRPDELAQDTTRGIEPILHALQEVEGYDYVVLLQPTSPLRIAEDIDRTIEIMIEESAPACVSVTETQESPYWMYRIEDNQQLQPLLSQSDLSKRRQDLPSVFVLNGAVYVAEVEWLKNTKSFLTDLTVAYKMPKERSYDIDTEMDFKACEWMLG